MSVVQIIWGIYLSSAIIFGFGWRFEVSKLPSGHGNLRDLCLVNSEATRPGNKIYIVDPEPVQFFLLIG